MSRRLGPRAELLALKRFITELERCFLAAHRVSPTLGPPSRRESLDVAAYIVLAYGAFENFIEGLGLWMLEKLEDSWINKQRATRTTASILLYSPVPTDEMTAGVTIFNNLRTAVLDAKSETSKQIAQNHGITPAHLRALFRPLGVDVPEDAVLVASLDLLISLRHQWAHQYRFGGRVLKSAHDVRKTVADCLDLAERLATEVTTARP